MCLSNGSSWLMALWVCLAPMLAAAQVQPRFKLGGFPDWVTSVAISPDGRLLAAGSYDVVKLFQLEDSRELAQLPTACGFAQSLLFTPDSARLIVGGYQQVQVWDAVKHSQTAVLNGHKGYVRDLALRTGDQMLATASEDQTIRLWNLAEGAEVRRLGPVEFPVLGVAWSPDGSLLATAEGDENRLTKPGLIKLWNPESGELTRSFPPLEKGATDVAFTADGSRLLATGLDEHVTVFEVAAGTALGFFGGHSRPTNCVLVLPGGEFAASGSGGRFKGQNEIKLFRVVDGEELATLELHEAKVTALALSPDGKTLASAAYDKTVAVWDLIPLLPTGVPDAGRLEAGAAPVDRPIPVALAQNAETPPEEPAIMRIGIIGLDTSHAVAFTKLINAETQQPAFVGFRVVAAYPQGSPDIESSTSRVPGYTEEVVKLGVEIVGSIDELVGRVDAVLLETNDGRPHLEQVLPVLKAKKPVFVDKPIAASLEDALAILAAAKHYGTPCFSASSLRWIGQAAEARRGDFGPAVGCDTYSPCSLEPTHPDLYWYGIHGVEALFAVMGPGLETVSRSTTENFELATGVWTDGRIGTFRGLRAGARGYGGTAFCEQKSITLGPYPGYQPLVESIMHFFKTGEAPVSAEETLEIYTFMSAADESKRLGGVPVEVGPLRAAAQAAADEKLQELIDGYQP